MEQNSKDKEYQDWLDGFDKLDFEGRARRFKDKILESDELDDSSRSYFSDAFEYVVSLYKSGKPLDTNLLKIHMTEIKNHKDTTIEGFARTMILLSLCGFDFSGGNKTK